MWMKTRFAQWEVEGQVRERVRGALAECEQGRLAAVAAGGTRKRRIGRYFTMTKAGLGGLPPRLHAAWHAWLRSRETPRTRRMATQSEPQAAADASPDALPSSAHRS